jgi:2-polyprenyl-3-methyl-5-hydroxy-6-metoxy-1,4-benzoquinol methylase
MDTKHYYRSVYWDEERDLTQKRLLSNRSSRRLHDLVFQHLQYANHILDVGCGAGGIYVPALLQTAQRIVGIDLSETALSLARRKGIAAAACNLQQPLPFPSASFDGIISIEVLEHLFYPQDTVREIVRILKPNGTVVFSVPNIAHFPNRLRMLGGKFVPGGLPATANRPWQDPHIRFFTPQSLTRMITECNLEIVHLYGNSAAILRELPIVSRLLRRILSKDTVRKLSDPFEPLGWWWPTLFAGRIILVARRRDDR